MLLDDLRASEWRPHSPWLRAAKLVLEDGGAGRESRPEQERVSALTLMQPEDRSRGAGPATGQTPPHRAQAAHHA